MRTYRFVVLLMLLAKTAMGSDERERPSPAQQNCARKARQALHAYQQKDAQRAHERLTQLWSSTHCHQIAALLGQTELALGKYRDAAEHLSFAVENLREPEASKNREGIQNALARAKAKVGTLQIKLNHPSTEISIDGQPIRKTPLDVEHFVNPGMHRIRATRASFGAIELKFEIRPGEQQPIELRLSAPSETLTKASHTSLGGSSAEDARPGQPLTPGTVTPDRRWSRREKVAVLAGGGAIAATAVGAGVYFQIQGNQSRDRAKQLSTGLSRCSESPDGRCAELRDAIDERGRNYTTAKVLYGVGAAVGISTTILAFVLPSQAATSERPAVKGWLSPSTAGVIVSGRF